MSLWEKKNERKLIKMARIKAIVNPGMPPTKNPMAKTNADNNPRNNAVFKWFAMLIFITAVHRIAQGIAGGL